MYRRKPWHFLFPLWINIPEDFREELWESQSSDNMSNDAKYVIEYEHYTGRSLMMDLIIAYIIKTVICIGLLALSIKVGDYLAH